MDTAEQGSKCGVLLVPGRKKGSGSKRMIVWRSESATGRPLPSPYTILARPSSQTKGWPVCRFVLLPEKPIPQHALGTGEPVLGSHFVVLCFSEIDAGSLEKLTREGLEK